MIMTKGIITQLPPEGSNIFKVEIPLMEDNTTNEAIFNAILCDSPGSYNGYEVGDIVIVHFQDHEMNEAIILGKLYTEIPKTDRAYLLANSIKITNTAELPSDTRINSYKLGDVVEAILNVSNVIGNNGVDLSTLKDFVKYIPTDREEDYFADRIQTVSGDEYDNIYTNPDTDPDEFNNTLYFLTSPSNISTRSRLFSVSSEG